MATTFPLRIARAPITMSSSDGNVTVVATEGCAEHSKKKVTRIRDLIDVCPGTRSIPVSWKVRRCLPSVNSQTRVLLQELTRVPTRKARLKRKLLHGSRLASIASCHRQLLISD